MASPSVLVQTLLGNTVSIPLSFGQCPTQSGYAWQPFTLNDNLVRLGNDECGLNLKNFANASDQSLWYSYETQRATFTLPMLSYVEFDKKSGDRFMVGSTECTLDLSADQHVFPEGIAVLALTESDGLVKWQQRTSGTIGSSCIVSAAQLHAALGYYPNRAEPAVILPEEEWHAFVSLIFVFLGIVYLLGDIQILDSDDSIHELRKGDKKQWKKFFVLDGPLTALATCASIVANEVGSYSESWVVGQQIFLLVAVVVNFTVLVFYLYLDPKETARLRDLRMYVNVPIFIAILVPVMHASGNLLELGCIVANIVTTYVSQRHFFDIRRTMGSNPDASLAILVHYGVAIFNIFCLAPAILLTIIHSKVGGIGVRLAVAEALTVGSLAIFG